MIIQIATPHDNFNGYGMTRDNLERCLRKEGITWNRYPDKVVNVGLCYSYPAAVQNLTKCKKKIIYTMFESTKMPKDWYEHFTEASKILVPSRFVQETLLRFGFNSEVVPLGIDGDTFGFFCRILDRKPNKEFTFLHYNAFNSRKGWWDLHNAFIQEFKPAEPVKMIYKVTTEAKSLDIKYPNIDVIREDYSAKQLSDLCKRSDCFVFPSKGEGFGLPPLEAGATGMPVITVDAHGISEYFNDKYFRGLYYGYEPAEYAALKGDLGNFIRVPVPELRREMRRAYNDWSENPKKYYHQGMALAHYVHENYRYENAAKKLAVILKEFDHN